MRTKRGVGGCVRPTLVAGLLLAWPALAEVPDLSFSVVNRANSAIATLYIEPIDVRCWCSDALLGVDAIPPGASITMEVRLGVRRTCIFDLKAVYADGHTEERRSANLCQEREVVFSGPVQRRP